MREPLRWQLQLGARKGATQLEAKLRNSAIGPVDDTWVAPGWLLPHQIDSARRITASIDIFRGALLADAVGLGKTYVALATATRFHEVVAVVPAALVSQWNRASKRVGVSVKTITHEALSRSACLPAAELVIVDEAHRFRNPKTRRYENLARAVKLSRVLLLTATPVVNRPSDLVHLLRLFASDVAFALFGMSSMEKTLATRDYGLLSHAVAPAVVARSAESIDGIADLLPSVRDGTVFRAGSTERSTMWSLLEIVDTLEFPGVFGSRDSALLRLHLLHRLASSAAAFRDTVNRHRAYTDRALSSLERGEVLSRSLARRIFATDDELQFAFDGMLEHNSNEQVNPEALRADRNRLHCISKLLSKTNGSSPKSRALANVLKRRTGRKTIVFTTAVATALNLARWLGWKETAVIGAGRGWIASGPLPVDELLTLFAPKARNYAEPHRSMRLRTLIATDLASEGLDLQDADAVVHYDLPWTPLRLEQRVGRIARLGSEFRTSDVYWFAPPEALDRRLRLEARIAQKVRDQTGLHVPATSSVGRARILNERLVRREQLGRGRRASGRHSPHYAVARGPLCAVVAVLWLFDKSEVPELIAFGGDRLEQVSDYAAVDNVLAQLLAAPPSSAAPPRVLIDRVLELVRSRLASADRGCTCQQSRRFRRRIMTMAYAAGRRRERWLLEALDSVLDRLRFGLNTGGERLLADLLRRQPSRKQIGAWLAEQPAPQVCRPAFEVVAALFGDGSTNAANERVSD